MKPRPKAEWLPVYNVMRLAAAVSYSSKRRLDAIEASCATHDLR